jgi:hypothetical protein
VFTGYKDATFYSRSGRFLTAVILAIGVLGTVEFFVNHRISAGIVATAALALVAVALYLFLWRPRLEVTDAGILVVNPLRSRRFAWTSIRSVEMRWLLTITTTSGSVAVWAVPRQSRASDAFGMRTDMRGLPDYAAQKQHEEQDNGSGAQNAALRVIRSRLDG